MAQTVSQPRPAAIAAVLAKASTWTHGTRKVDGREFWIIAGSLPGTVYYADATNCTCPSAQNRAGVCKHSEAIRQHQAPPAQPARRTYADLYPVCSVSGCDEDALRSGKCLDHRARAAA